MYWAKQAKIKVRHSVVYHPSGNMTVETTIKKIKHVINDRVKSNRSLKMDKLKIVRILQAENKTHLTTARLTLTAIIMMYRCPMIGMPENPDSAAAMKELRERMLKQLSAWMLLENP